MSKSSKNQSNNSSIADNRKARHDYHIETTFEAGIQLQGWELKSIRAGRVQLRDSYVIVKQNEVWLLNAHITPLLSASTHINPETLRTRKLLLHREEINKLIGQVERKGYTLIPLGMYWKGNHVKLGFGLAKGKKQHDKRQDAKDKSWASEKQRLVKMQRSRIN